MNTKRSIRFLPAVALALAMLAGFAAQADATVIDTDRPRITTKGFDFGTNWDGFGAPLNGGDLDWDWTNGIVTPQLTGNLYLKNVSGECAKIQVIYYDDNHNFIDLEESPVHCAASNSRSTHAIDIEPEGNQFISHAHVKINTLGANGIWVTAETQNFNLN